MGVKPATSETVYEPVPFWAKIPHGLWFKEATSVAVDADDRVYVFNRGNMPVMIFDKDGNLVDTWGNDTPLSGTELFEDPYGNMMPRFIGGRFIRPHAIIVDHEENLWLVDDVGNLITKTDKKGNTLLTIGTGKPERLPERRAVQPPDRRRDLAEDRRHLHLGRLPQLAGPSLRQERQPHQVVGRAGHRRGPVQPAAQHRHVRRRRRHRLRPREPPRPGLLGRRRVPKTWHAHKAVAVFAGRGEDTNVYVAEQGPPPVQHGVRNVGHKIQIYNRDGKRVTKFGAELPGEGPDQFNWLHSVAVDSEGSVYAAEVSYVEVGSKLSPPRELVSLRKWRRAKG